MLLSLLFARENNGLGSQSSSHVTLKQLNSTAGAAAATKMEEGARGGKENMHLMKSGEKEEGEALAVALTLY